MTEHDSESCSAHLSLFITRRHAPPRDEKTSFFGGPTPRGARFPREFCSSFTLVHLGVPSRPLARTRARARRADARRRIADNDNDTFTAVLRSRSGGPAAWEIRAR